MNKNEVIIEVGAEGGSITLYGLRAKRGWLFSLESSDWTPELLGDERIENKSQIVDNWAAALKLLDRYPWSNLFPIRVHAHFRKKVWEALQERSLESTEEPHERELNRRWRRICSV